MGGKIIKTERLEIWGHARTLWAAGNEPHSQLLQGQDIPYIICKKKIELRPPPPQKKICWEMNSVLCPLKSFCDSCPGLSFCLAYPCNSSLEHHRA